MITRSPEEMFFCKIWSKFTTWWRELWMQDWHETQNSSHKYKICGRWLTCSGIGGLSTSTAATSSDAHNRNGICTSRLKLINSYFILPDFTFNTSIRWREIQLIRKAGILRFWIPGTVNFTCFITCMACKVLRLCCIWNQTDKVLTYKSFRAFSSVICQCARCISFKSSYQWTVSKTVLLHAGRSTAKVI